jgi:hypothetical protein
MNLTQIYSRCNKATYFSRSDDEIWDAINDGIRWAYQNVLKENQGYWIKFDTSTVSLVPGTTQYALPADLQDILRVRERVNAADQWRLVRNGALTDESIMRDYASATTLTFDSDESQFTFFGPFELASVAEDSTDDQTYEIQFSPQPVDTRQVELVYTVKCVDVTSPSSYLLIPDDGRPAVRDYAIGSLLALNGDERAQNFFDSAQSKLTMFLTVVRDRQLQDERVVTPYLDDMD